MLNCFTACGFPPQATRVVSSFGDKFVVTHARIPEPSNERMLHSSTEFCLPRVLCRTLRRSLTWHNVLRKQKRAHINYGAGARTKPTGDLARQCDTARCWGPISRRSKFKDYWGGNENLPGSDSPAAGRDRSKSVLSGGRCVVSAGSCQSITKGLVKGHESPML